MYPHQGGIAMIEAISCGGVVIYRGKVLLLYKNIHHRYEGWVLREVKEESNVDAKIIKYVGKSSYTFTVPEGDVSKDVHWYLMRSNSYQSRPQREEFFVDSGYYKYHEAYHLLKFPNEKDILEKAYNEYLELKSAKLWTNRNF